MDNHKSQTAQFPFSRRLTRFPFTAMMAIDNFIVRCGGGSCCGSILIFNILCGCVYGIWSITDIAIIAVGIDDI